MGQQFTCKWPRHPLPRGCCLWVRHLQGPEAILLPPRAAAQEESGNKGSGLSGSRALGEVRGGHGPTWREGEKGEDPLSGCCAEHSARLCGTEARSQVWVHLSSSVLWERYWCGLWKSSQIVIIISIGFVVPRFIHLSVTPLRIPSENGPLYK